MVRNESGGLSPKQEKSSTSKLVELVGIVIFALLLAFVIQLFLVKTYRIPSGSMEPTLDIGQRVLVNRVGMNFGDPSVGDIVVFHPPAGADVQPARCGAPDEGGSSARPCSVATPEESDQTFIKRVVGVGGDTIAIRDGRVIRNGRPTREPFINECGDGFGCSFPGTITVPDGSFYMMGDNRGASDDSRYWGPVPKDWLIGTTFATYWPPDRIGIF
ncbi:signal peptidase I [Conexibacter stalactiti]|uniref:Signal peptidase I n=1 Tax=Conexibacter stalactiti TaxID=1940611 RepID=A0ABU4HLM6_9ACTN|nr:signal peptidase I [Conexibacter stalactiti]MDW5594162.1 signal peptidase I [Conexibacter stalactiti]MEC5034804.1 signal peptidase I [Conexibacter stalactiti]